MAENQLGEGGSHWSVVPGPLPALHSSFPQPFSPCLGSEMGASPGRSCLPASAGSRRALSALSPAVPRIAAYHSTPAARSSASPVTSQGKRLVVSPCNSPWHKWRDAEVLAAVGRQGRDGRAEEIIFQFHLSWALA